MNVAVLISGISSTSSFSHSQRDFVLFLSNFALILARKGSDPIEIISLFGLEISVVF